MEDLGKNSKKRFQKPYKKHYSYRNKLKPFFLGVAMLFIMADFLGGKISYGAAGAASSSPPRLVTKSCNIKGNVSYNQGRKIFHVPGQKDYHRTKISSHRGERWFCSEAEARAAGWRKARR